MAAKRKSWLGEFWRPLAALLLWVLGMVPLIAAPPLLPSFAETRIGGLTTFPVDCIPAAPLFPSDLTRACGPPLYDLASDCSVAANSVGASSRLVPGGGLMAHEGAGGHLLARHLGQTDAQLSARLAAQPRLPAASTFGARTEAEAAVAGAFDHNAAQLSTWTAGGANGRLVLNAPFPGGSVMFPGASASVPGTGVRVVLQGNGSGGYHVLTGFPTP